ncbi:MAG: hypothetical protein K8T10_13800 [Candidatus Eremiobacteraeota bacterium]|nr:hypothetical protein [Candidatus Eremiobacteraeota bacterium]
MKNKASIFFIIMFLLFLTANSIAGAQDHGYTFPTPDKKGDFVIPRSHRYWKVVDNDRNGLNGRLATNFPVNWEDPRVAWPKSNVAQWPIAARFRKGSILNATRGNRGIIFLRDRNKKPWIMIEISKGKYCFVRANTKYIVPVKLVK